MLEEYYPGLTKIKFKPSLRLIEKLRKLSLRKTYRMPEVLYYTEMIKFHQYLEEVVAAFRKNGFVRPANLKDQFNFIDEEKKQKENE